MLLASLEGQHEPALALDIAGLAGDPARHLAHERLAGGKEPKRRAAEVQPIAERLSFADGDVNAAFAGRSQHRERQRIARADRQRPCRLGRGRERLDVLDSSHEVGLLHHDGADPIVERRQLGDAILQRNLDDFHPPSARQRREHLSRMRVHPARDHEARPAGRELRHVTRGTHGARPLVDGGVGDGEPGQLRDRRLVFEHRLQATLGYLGLVGRVRSQELRALDDRVDKGRDVVVVHAGAEKRDLVIGRDVFRGERAQLLEHLLLGATLAQAQGTTQPQ